MNKTRKRQLSAIIGIVALGTLVSSTASASIPASNGEIHGCYRPTGVAQGELVVIDDTETCPSGYTALNWSKQGPAGVSGYETVVDQSVTPSGAYTVSCPTGKKAISGGVKWNGLYVDPIEGSALVSSYPTANGSGWTIVYRMASNTIDVYAVCANA